MNRRGFLTSAAAAPMGAAAVSRMKLAVGCDHAGFPLKGTVTALLKQWGHTVTDCGTHSTDPVDFPDIAKKVCDEVLAGRAERGVLVCGTGVGACIAGNKVRGAAAPHPRPGISASRRAGARCRGRPAGPSRS